MKYENDASYKIHPLLRGIKTFEPLIAQKTKKYIIL